MSLKKDIQEQSTSLKLAQDQIVQLTFERDAARAESKRLRAAAKEGTIITNSHFLIKSGSAGLNLSEITKSSTLQATDMSSKIENALNLAKDAVAESYL